MNRKKPAPSDTCPGCHGTQEIDAAEQIGDGPIRHHKAPCPWCKSPPPPPPARPERMSELAFRLAVADARKRGDPESLAAECRRARRSEEELRRQLEEERRLHRES